MKKISSYIKEHLFAYSIAVICLLIGVTLDMLSPILTKNIIDRCILGNEIELLPKILIGILIIGFGKAFFMYYKEYLFDTTGAKISADMRKNMFDHLQSLSASFFDKNSTGELMARVKDDIDRIWDGLTYVSMLLIEVVVHTVLVLYCMISLSWKLAIIPTVLMIICAVLAIYLEKKLDKVYDDISEENATLNTIAEENLTGIRTVKAFARESFEIKKFMKHNEKYCDLNMTQTKVFVKYHPYFTLVTRVLPLLIVLFGGLIHIYDPEGFTLGSLGAFIQYSYNIVWPMEMMGWLTNSFSSAIASNKKIKKIYAETSEIKEDENMIFPETVKGKISFENVTFSMGDTQILKDISFEVGPGKTLGIMGETGSGKSTVASLIQRLYNPDSGEIKLDDINIEKLPLQVLRGSIECVMQDVFLFSDTIDNNIRLGNEDELTEEEVKKASETAQASEFIEKLEDKYDTVIGERGVGLSGGQKQRISIARALSKKNPVLIMDDSTSALDMETETLIEESLIKMPNTKIIIAHRISAVRNADEIIILKGGEIAERGTHDELLKKKGLYYETYKSQYGEYAPEVV
ncbi:MAG: ABC transporter ATP-binding protein [Lachnospiraceae bacterium]|nr:ABC transporter ATP-binding protein [Lachnospiraceae bacterium]